MGRRNKKEVIVENITITGLADKGRGVGRSPEGIVFFVEGAVPGDIMHVKVLKQKEGFVEAKIQEIVHYSEYRTTPFCEHFGMCGGCKYQNMTYESQLKYKEEMVINALQRIGKVDIKHFDPILYAENSTYYRNKLEFAFSSMRWLTDEQMKAGESKFEDVVGFHIAGAFGKILDINHCYLQEEPSNTIRNTIRTIAKSQQLSFYDVKNHVGLLRHVMIRITKQGQTLLIFSFGEDKPKQIQRFLASVKEELPQITTIFYCINTKVNDFILDLEMHLYSGPGYVEEKLRDVLFRIGPHSFFQTHTRQAERLFDTVVEFAELSGKENVYDLYTGIGSIALYIAKFCKQVVGIEEIPGAIDDAKANAALNGMTNTVFYTGDVKNILTKEFAEKHGKPDVLITDPPRAGMHSAVAEMLLELEAPKLIYVSCNPATQARDMHILSKKYQVDRVRPVDMFPQTHHIESVALLTLKK